MGAAEPMSWVASGHGRTSAQHPADPHRRLQRHTYQEARASCFWPPAPGRLAAEFTRRQIYPLEHNTVSALFARCGTSPSQHAPAARSALRARRSQGLDRGSGRRSLPLPDRAAPPAAAAAGGGAALAARLLRAVRHPAGADERQRQPVRGLDAQRADPVRPDPRPHCASVTCARSTRRRRTARSSACGAPCSARCSIAGC
jgi:hypothetical protein